jgi:hypothetical protein
MMMILMQVLLHALHVGEIYGANMMLFLGMGMTPDSPFYNVRTRSSGRHYNADHEQNAASLSPQGGDKGSSREQPEPLKKASAPGDEGQAMVF